MTKRRNEHPEDFVGHDRRVLAIYKVLLWDRIPEMDKRDICVSTLHDPEQVCRAFDLDAADLDVFEAARLFIKRVKRLSE
jgi:hypothetical protein